MDANASINPCRRAARVAKRRPGTDVNIGDRTAIALAGGKKNMRSAPASKKKRDYIAVGDVGPPKAAGPCLYIRLEYGRGTGVNTVDCTAVINPPLLRMRV